MFTSAAFVLLGSIQFHQNKKKRKTKIMHKKETQKDCKPQDAEKIERRDGTWVLFCFFLLKNGFACPERKLIAEVRRQMVQVRCCRVGSWQFFVVSIFYMVLGTFCMFSNRLKLKTMKPTQCSSWLWRGGGISVKWRQRESISTYFYFS